MGNTIESIYKIGKITSDANQQACMNECHIN